MALTIPDQSHRVERHPWSQRFFYPLPITRPSPLAPRYPLLLFPPVDHVILSENRWRGHSPLHLRQNFLDSPLARIAVFFDDFGGVEPGEFGGEGR